MKVFERVLDRWIRDFVQLTVNQAGFVKGCETTDAIHAVRRLSKKHREKQRSLHVAFLDLEKAFGRVPHELTWCARRRHQVPDELVTWFELLYSEPKSQV